MQEDYLNKLKKQIKKTGFPTELEVGRIFTNLGWEVEHNTYFIDKDEAKGREIDLIAELSFQNNDKNKHYTECIFQFVTEIKNEKNRPWVIFSTKTSSFERAIYSIPTDKIYNNFDENKLSKSFKEHNLKLMDRLGRSFTQGFSQSKDKIYASLCNAAKAFTYSIENTCKDNSADSLLTYVEPLVIVNGQLFEAFLNEDSELVVEQTDILQFRFNYISEFYNKRTNGYIINIVTKEYLPNFLDLRKKQFRKIFNENKHGLQQQI